MISNVFGLLIGIAASTTASAGQVPVHTASGYDSRLAGQWLSKGYGYVLDIKQDQMTLYHVADGLCLKDPREGPDPDGLFVQWQRQPDGKVALHPVRVKPCMSSNV